jgi:hypothetical protein
VSKVYLLVLASPFEPIKVPELSLNIVKAKLNSITIISSGLTVNVLEVS